MLTALLCCAALAAAQAAPAQDDVTPRPGESCGYDSCKDAIPGVLNVHIVAHTHDDVGWLKTIDQYYYGSRNNIQKAGVKYILDSVVKELWEDPKRKFIYVETAFFWKWWSNQPAATRARVHTLVRQGRLQFVGGAWSMNDEAASHYRSTIDQFTWGLRKLNYTFGACGRPLVGWQIDPFGHSREFASELALMGYDGLFLGRIDYQDKRKRMKTRTMEMMWRGDDDLGEASDIFTSVLYNTYSPPPGFCFDVLCNDEPIIDDVESPMYNADKRVTEFLEVCANMSKAYHTNNILVTMGEDFQYQDAAMWFDNLDKLIEHANLKAATEKLNVKLFYSTPACYLKAVKSANPTLPIKKDDFFPYASDPTAYWTGYFTSRPTTKRMEREGNNYLQTFKMLQALTNLPVTNMIVLNQLKSAMGVMQHHDAITGTEKQHVAHDYERILTRAVDDALTIGVQGLSKLTKSKVVLEYERCEFNQSQCAVTEQSNAFILTVFNNQGRPKESATVTLPVESAAYSVFDDNGDKIHAEIQEISSEYLTIPTRESKATHNLFFKVNAIPAMGFKSYYIKRETNRYKRDTKDKRIPDYYNVNDYFKDVKDRIEIDIRNAEANSYVPNEDNFKDRIELDIRNAEEVSDVPNVDNNVEIIVGERDGVIAKRGYENDFNWEVLRDGEEKGRKESEEIKDLIKQATKKMAEDSLRAAKKDNKLVFSLLSDDELRMLADGPMTVEVPSDIVLENNFITLSINKETGWMNYVSKTDGTTLNYLAVPGYYIGCVGNNEVPANRSSGAYIFRPNMTETPELKIFQNFAVMNVIRSTIKQEVTLRYDDTVTLTIGINGNTTYINSVIGNIPLGTEYVLRFKTDLETNGEFYTDSNGRQIIKRVRDHRPTWNLTLEEPIPGNYYPVVSEIYIENDDVRVVVNVDRARGGASMKDGCLEIMQHRRLKHDDAFGVGEALNETANGAGLYSVDSMIVQIVPKNRENLINAAEESNAFFSPPQLFVAPADVITFEKFKKMVNVYSLMKNPLPVGVNLLSVEPWADRQMLLRFENYLDSQLSPEFIAVDLENLFRTVTIKSIRETTLAANVYLDEFEKWNWRMADDLPGNFEEFTFDDLEVESEKSLEMKMREKLADEFGMMVNEEFGDDDESHKKVRAVPDELIIKLKPKQIRTFIADYRVAK